MSIDVRLTDNLIASTALDKTLVPNLDSVAHKGPIPMDPKSADLEKIAKFVKTNLPKPKAGDAPSHARPSMLAHISSFAKNVDKAWEEVSKADGGVGYSLLDRNARNDFVEWQGLVAAVALNNIYSGMGLSLSVQTVELDGTETNRDPGRRVLDRCILMEMDKDPDYRTAITQRESLTDAPLKGRLYYICQQGKPFALYHPIVGLCPMKEYDATIFDGVLPWHKSLAGNCHGGWKAIMEPDGTTSLDDFCLCRIAWWAKANDMVRYSAYIQERQKNRDHVPASNLQAITPILNSTDINKVWDGKGTAFGTTMMFYTDEFGNACPMPNLFMDTMLLTYTGGRENNCLVYTVDGVEKRICFQGDPVELENFAPVAPFRKEFMKLLANGTLQELIFDAALENSKLRSVTLTVVVKTNAGETFTIHRTYGHTRLRQGQLPYLMIWPYLPMPKGMDFWKDFYATWHSQPQEVDLLIDVDEKLIPTTTGISFDFDGQGKTRKINRRTAPSKQYWTVCNSDSPFHYALVTGKENATSETSADVGMVFMPEYATFLPDDEHANVINNAPVKLAVDFGTTSTVCAVKLEGQDPVQLPFRDYSHCVTRKVAKAKSTLDVEHWLGNTNGGTDWKFDRKIFSVAQLFQRTDGTGPNRADILDAQNQDYYVDGRLFLVSGNAMTNFASSSGSSLDPLGDQWIMSDMKFAQKLDVLNYHAAAVYLAGVYAYAVLYLLRENVVPGKKYLELVVSYPNNVTMKALRGSWEYAHNILDKMMVPKLTQAIPNLLYGNGGKFYDEATATTAFMHSPDSYIGLVSSLVSVDIGGGTTDISISNKNLHPGQVRNLSIRYAGREIMVSSLIELFRRFNKSKTDSPIYKRDAAFASLWKPGMEANAESTNDILTQFATVCRCEQDGVAPGFLRALTGNSTVRMNVEMLLAEGVSMGKADDRNPSNLVRQLITLKFLMVMKIVARAVRENIDMWWDSKTEKLNLIGKTLEINLAINGTSAQLLEYVFDCRTSNDLTKLADTILVTDEDSERMSQCMDVLNAMFYQELKDVLEPDQQTDLRIHVNPHVQEKKEVCFGMLSDKIDTFVAPMVTSAASTGSKRPTLGGVRKRTDSTSTDADRAVAEKEMMECLHNYDFKKLEKYLNGCSEKDEPGLLDYMRTYEDIYFQEHAPSNKGLTRRINTISDLLYADKTGAHGDYTPHYAKSCAAVAQSRAAFMIEPEQQAYKDLLACMYIVDEMLDWEIAGYQL